MNCSFSFRGVEYAIEAKALAWIGEGGKGWYREGGEEIRAYSERVGVPFQYVCDVLSILSPRVTVEHNVKLTHAWVTTGKAPGAMRQRIAALEKYEKSGVFSGPKVNAFAKALAGDPHAIVIDAWMYRVLGDKRRTDKAYREASDKVRQVASALGWAPAETQAAIWGGVRALVGFSDTQEGAIRFPGRV